MAAGEEQRRASWAGETAHSKAQHHQTHGSNIIFLLTYMRKGLNGLYKNSLKKYAALKRNIQ